MREIILDIETTGLDNKQDRIIEIGCVELFNKIPTGKEYHQYINPQGKEINARAQQIHGISNAMLEDKPCFPEIIEELLSFIKTDKIIAHNANFDIGFINEELKRLGRDIIPQERVIDSLLIARKKFPMGPNSLDALCRRFSIDNSARSLHGALLDAQILAKVYIELHGGKQKRLDFIQEEQDDTRNNSENNFVNNNFKTKQRERKLASRLTEDNKKAHNAFVETLGDAALWKKFQ